MPCCPYADIYLASLCVRRFLPFVPPFNTDADVASIDYLSPGDKTVGEGSSLVVSSW